MNDRAAELYDLIFDLVDYAAGAGRVHEIVQEYNPDARRLLDVACGAGRHLQHLRANYDVEGLDLSPILLKQARLRLPDVPLHLADMRDFDLPGRFDAITCLSSSIAYMKTLADLRLAIANMARHLNPAGVLIIEPWLSPESDPQEDEPFLTSYEEPGRKVVMLEITTLVGDLWVSQSHYLTATPDRIEHFSERVEQGAFTRSDNIAAFEATGLRVTHDASGILGRGLYIGVRPHQTF